MDLDKLFEKVPYDKLIPIPYWQRMAAVISVAVAILGLFYFAVVKNQDTEIGQLEEKLDKIQKEVEDNRRIANKIDELKSKMVKLEAELKEASRHLPSKKEIPKLLEDISNIGTQAGLEFVKFKPQPEGKREFYATVPVSLKITGKFHKVLNFFDEISHLPRIVTINNINMQAGKLPNSTTLTVDCQAITYRFLEKSLQKKKEGEGKGKGKGKKGKKK